MDGINKIIERIAFETREDISALQAETAEKCRGIKETFEKTAQEEYWEAVRSGVKECELGVQRLNSTAIMEAKKSILSMKQANVARVFEETEKRICNLPEEQYVDFLAKLAGKAASTGYEEIIFNSRDRSGCAKAVVKTAHEILKKRGIMPKLSVSVQTGDFKGGLIVKRGDIEVNCTVEKLIELSKEDLASQIAGVLFTD